MNADFSTQSTGGGASSTPQPGLPSAVHITIERLVFDGVDLPPEHVQGMVTALTAELRRLTQHDWAGHATRPATRENAVSLRTPDIELRVGATGLEIGHQVAGAIHTGLHGGGA